MILDKELRMSNLAQRLITGILFIAAIVCSLLWSPVPFVVLFLLFTLIALLEFYKMALKKSRRHLIIGGLASGAILYLTVSLYALQVISINWILINFVLVNLIFLLELFSKRSSAKRNTAYTILGVVYIAIPFALLNFFYEYNPGTQDYNPYFLLSFFILTWAYDTFAYVGGKLFGKTKLYEQVSPKKTWEGVVIGGLLTIAVACLLYLYFGQFELIHWLLISALVIILGTLGDLIESKFKRNFDIKDIGKVLPGHGGVLDRFDGLLFSAPAVLFYYYLIL